MKNVLAMSTPTEMNAGSSLAMNSGREAGGAAG